MCVPRENQKSRNDPNFLPVCHKHRSKPKGWVAFRSWGKTTPAQQVGWRPRLAEEAATGDMNFFSPKEAPLDAAPAGEPPQAAAPAPAADGPTTFPDGFSFPSLEEKSTVDRNSRFSRASQSLDWGNSGDGAQRLSVMYSRNVVDQEEIDERIAGFTLRKQQAVMRKKETVRVDPDSRHYITWLAVAVFISAMTISTAGYYVGFYTEFSTFHSIFVVDWVRLRPNMERRRLMLAAQRDGRVTVQPGR